MKLSVIVPAYNAEFYIKKNLRSIVDQNCKDVEIVVVDDGSTDFTAKNVKEIEKSYPLSNIKLISIENAGLANARNVGIRHATGDYFINLDADDFLENDVLEKLLAYLAKHKPDVCFYGMDNINEEGKT